MTWNPIVNKEAGVSVRSKINLAMGELDTYTTNYDGYLAIALDSTDIATEAQIQLMTANKLVTADTLRFGVLYHANSVALSQASGEADKIIKTNSDGFLDRTFVNTFYGTTTQRPGMSTPSGIAYFDTTLGKPVWFNGTSWVDATGTLV